MEFNARFKNSLKTVFKSVAIDDSDSQLSDELTLDSNNVFSRSLVIGIKSDEIEIPIIARDFYEDIISDAINYPHTNGVEKVILPLYTNIGSEMRRTFDGIIVQMFGVSYGSRLQKITTNKGDVYYGGRGIIFDADFTPLLLCTLTARKIQEQDEPRMVYYRPICHVNPKVFMESDKLVNKGIVKKVIPFFSNMKIGFPRDTRFRIDPESEKVKVVVDNFDNFFIKPVKPTPSTCSNDSLNQCLVDNIDDIMMLI